MLVWFRDHRGGMQEEAASGEQLRSILLRVTNRKQQLTMDPPAAHS